VEKKVVIGDGAEWIWNIANEHFPGAIQIVDLFHARQHLWELARKPYPNQDAEQRRWMMIHQDLLDRGKIEVTVQPPIAGGARARADRRGGGSPSRRGTPARCGAA
jgi:hypothetical protein